MLYTANARDDGFTDSEVVVVTEVLLASVVVCMDGGVYTTTTPGFVPAGGAIVLVKGAVRSLVPK